MMNLFCLCLLGLILIGGYFGFSEYRDQQARLEWYTGHNAQLSKINDENQQVAAMNKARLKDATRTVHLLREVTQIHATSLGDAPASGLLPPSLTTLSGRSYEQCHLDKVYPDGISFRHSGGVAKVYFIDLDESFAKAFSYDPLHGQKFEAEEAGNERSSDKMVMAELARERVEAQTLAAQSAAVPAPTAVVSTPVPSTGFSEWKAQPQRPYSGSRAVFDGGPSYSAYPATAVPTYRPVPSSRPSDTKAAQVGAVPTGK